MIYIPLADLPEAEASELVFNSRSPKEMEVTPTFYKRDGRIIPGDPVRVQSAEIRYVDFEKLLPEKHRGEGDWGGMSLSFYGESREMWSQLRFLSINGGSSVDEFFTVKDEPRSDIQEAAWWMPRKSIAIIALGNITDTPTSARVNFGDGESQTLSLAPHATELIRRKYSKEDGTESITINITGMPGSIIPTGVIASKDGSFNSAIRFYDTKKAKQPNLFANGLRLAGITPHMILKNTSSSPITAQPKFIASGGIEAAVPVVLPKISLASNETTEVDLTQLLQAVRNRQDLDVVSVQVANSGEPGSLIGSLYGINSGTGVDYEVPLRDSGPIRSMTGAYPWKITKDYTTIVYITNISDREAGFVTQINYDGGKFVIDPRKLAPGETAMFDLRKIRDEQMKDNAGRHIPKGTSLGQFKWAIHGVTGGKLVLIGRAEMVSRSQHISTSYSCSEACPPYYGGTVTIPSPIIMNATGTATASMIAYYGSGYSTGPYGAEANWSIDTPVASFNPSESVSSTTVTGTSPGTGFLLAEMGQQEWYVFDGLECIDNGPYTVEDGGPLAVTPHISSISPGYGAPGTVIQVSIDGMGFAAGSTVQVGGSGITVSGTNVVSSTQITTDFTIAGNASGGAVSVTVTSGGQTSDSASFSIRVPHHLVVVSDTGNNNIRGDCQAVFGLNSFPRIRQITFRVVDCAGNDVGAVTTQENFTNMSTNTCGNGAPTPNSCHYLFSGGSTFTDTITVNCNSVGGSCGYNITDDWQWCPSGGTVRTLATLTETVHNDVITINQNTSGFTAGTLLGPTGCP